MNTCSVVLHAASDKMPMGCALALHLQSLGLEESCCPSFGPSSDKADAWCQIFQNGC